jgi:hypothetical protein
MSKFLALKHWFLIYWISNIRRRAQALASEAVVPSLLSTNEAIAPRSIFTRQRNKGSSEDDIFLAVLRI